MFSCVHFIEQIKPILSTQEEQDSFVRYIKFLIRNYRLYIEKIKTAYPDLDDEKLAKVFCFHRAVVDYDTNLSEQKSAEFFESLYTEPDVSLAIRNTSLMQSEFVTALDEISHDLCNLWLTVRSKLLLRETEYIQHHLNNRTKSYVECVEDLISFYKSLIDKNVFVSTVFVSHNTSVKENIQKRIQSLSEIIEYDESNHTSSREMSFLTES